MSIETTTNRIGYSGNGSTTAFSFPYKFLASGDLKVYIRNASTGVETLKTLTTHYTVSGAGVSSGGTVTMLVAPASGETLVIYNDPALTQGLDLRENDNLPAESVETAFDRVTILAQRLKDRVDRSVRLSDAFSPTFDPTLPSDLASAGSKIPLINSGGTGFDLAANWPDVSGVTSGMTASAAAAATSATAAATSATAAAGSVTTAAASATSAASSATASSTSATSAAGSATAAANTLASALWRAVVRKTSVNSPYTVTSSDNGKLIVVDTTGGAVVINMPQISTLTLPFTVGIQLDAGSNTVTINRAGTDTVDGSTSKVLSLSGAGAQFLADDTPSPDEWEIIDFGGVTSTVPISLGGTGQITADAALNALLPSQTGNNNKVLKSNGSSTSWASAGSGGGSKNYLGVVNGTDNGGDFENNTVGSWVLGTATLTSNLPTGVPTFGSGASGNLSGAIVSSGQLSGSYSYSYASSAASTAGNFLASPAVTIDTSDQARVMTFKFSYKAVTNPTNANWSGTSSNSFGVAIYDVTAAAWIIPAGVWSMTQSSGVGIATGTFQTTSSSTQYRFVVFNANATSGAATVYFDDFSVGPQASAIGVPANDWQSYTPTFGAGFGTVTSPAGVYRRVGGELEVRVACNTGTVTAAVGSISLPSGVTVDSTKLTITGNTTGQAGTRVGEFSGNSTNMLGPVLTAPGTSTSLVYVGGNVGTSTMETVSASASTTSIASSAAFAASFKIPVSGWSSNVQMSNDTDTRIVALYAYRTSNTSALAAATDTLVAFPTVSFDTFGAFNGSQDTYTVPVSGKYRISGTLYFTYGASSTATQVKIYKNGSLYAVPSVLKASSGQSISNAYTITLDLVAGDTIKIYGYADAGTATVVASDSNKLTFLNIERLSGPAVVAATESVNMRYYNSATTITSSAATITYSTKDFDSHGAYSSGVYTVPVSGKYLVNASIYITATFSAGNNPGLQIQKNGSDVSAGVNVVTASSSVVQSVKVSDIISCVAGDTLRVQAQSTGTSPTITSNNQNNFLSIARVGN